MALNTVHVRIGTLRVPAHSPLDRVELRRVEHELAALLQRMPLAAAHAGADVRLELSAVRVPLATSVNSASVAYALARHIYAALSFGEGRG